jgi:hypothetical protein
VFSWDIESIDDFTQNKGEKSYTVEELSTSYLDNYFGSSSDNNYISGFDDPSYTWTWKVSGTAIVGTRTYTGTSFSSTYVLEIRLDTDKRFKSLRITSTYTENGVTNTSGGTETITYNANPYFPSGFNKADFKPESSSYESSASLRAKWEAITGIGGRHRAMQP